MIYNMVTYVRLFFELRPYDMTVVIELNLISQYQVRYYRTENF